MDDETKQLLREIRDLQREHLELIRANLKEASDVNRVALENHTKWNQQSKQSTKLMVIIVVVVFVGFVALEIMKRLR
ncbi:MAG TPA: hypothetical protein VJA21_21280 [Verrucomicrobiae bacterium]